MDEQRVIGRANRLPWKLPADMGWFRRHTLGKPILMGRKTFDSLGRKALPQRTNIVISRNRELAAEGVVVVASLQQALTAAAPAAECMVIGGAQIYQQALPLAQRLYITQVHDVFDGDTWFPEFDLSQWREVCRERHARDERNPHEYSFLIYERR